MTWPLAATAIISIIGTVTLMLTTQWFWTADHFPQWRAPDGDYHCPHCKHSKQPIESRSKTPATGANCPGAWPTGRSGQ